MKYSRGMIIRGCLWIWWRRLQGRCLWAWTFWIEFAGSYILIWSQKTCCFAWQKLRLSKSLRKDNLPARNCTRIDSGFTLRSTILGQSTRMSQMSKRYSKPKAKWRSKPQFRKKFKAQMTMRTISMEEAHSLKSQQEFPKSKKGLREKIWTRTKGRIWRESWRNIKRKPAKFQPK